MVLNTALLNCLKGREEQLQKIYNFLLHHLQNESSSLMYICGLPGTGKTACVSKICQIPEISNGFRIISLNCTLLTSLSGIFEKITKELQIKRTTKNRSFETTVYEYFESNDFMTLLILDEVDQLVSRKQKILHKLFELPLKKDAKLVLVGIANTVNLLEKVVPNLLNKQNKPEQITFSTYNEHQIASILKNRIIESKNSYIFSENALQLLAKKVALISGDIRNAFDLYQKVIDFYEMSGDSIIEIKHVLSVLKNFHGTSQTLAITTDEGLPLQQKIILTIILILKNEKKIKSLTLSQLYDNYRKISNKAKYQILDQCEFNSTCYLIESSGVIKIHSAKNIRLSKITLESDYTNLVAYLNDNTFLRQIMQHSSSINL